MPSFGENLRNLRKSRGYSQDRFAQAIGSNQVNVSAWELGTRMPNLTTIKHIADTFRVPLSSLLPIENTGMEEDIVQEVADMMQHDPKIRLLFDRAKYLTQDDLDAVISVVNAITRERSKSE